MRHLTGLTQIGCGTILAIIVSVTAYSTTPIEPPPIGNFSLPTSQRPGAFYSFGSKILGEGKVQARITPNIFKDTTAQFIGMPSTLQWGVSDDISLLYTLPATLDKAFRSDHEIKHTSGLGNMGLQGDYQFYERGSHIDKENAGLLLGFTVPSGKRSVSSSVPSYFVGATYTHTWIEWLWFAAPGYLVYEGERKDRPANQWYWELGVGKDLASESKAFCFTGFLEVNGQISEKKPTFTRGELFTNGYILFFSPSLFYANQRWIAQLGYSVPIVQHWVGTKEKVTYFTAFTLIRTFG